MSRGDKYNLARFLLSQAGDEDYELGSYEQALAEVAAGKKQTHWMWYIFPRQATPKCSEMSAYYELPDLLAAKAYLAHPVLGPRLYACTYALLAVEHRTAVQIFGVVDAKKLEESMSLFSFVTRRGSVFTDVIDKYFIEAQT